jgi:ABC-type xylose transport system substrate-binding protein
LVRHFNGFGTLTAGKRIANSPPSPPISGQDADLIAYQYIWQGIQTETMVKDGFHTEGEVKK